MNLSVEEQSKLFREIMEQRQQITAQTYQQQQQQQQQQHEQQQQQHEQQQQYGRQQQPRVPMYPYGQQSIAPQYLSPGIGYDGRKIGRNRDADMISTTADVYMAQLKRDSTSRNLARYAGDDASANHVFWDPKIYDITGPAHYTNDDDDEDDDDGVDGGGGGGGLSLSYVREQRLKERDMLEILPEEAAMFQSTPASSTTNTQQQRTTSGIAYREKIARAKQMKLYDTGARNDGGEAWNSQLQQQHQSEIANPTNSFGGGSGSGASADNTNTNTNINPNTINSSGVSPPFPPQTPPPSPFSN